jgi:hypothetical protein
LLCLSGSWIAIDALPVVLSTEVGLLREFVVQYHHATVRKSAMIDKQPPKAFISYSWDDETHRKWVKALAARLRNDGVDATLDRWNVTPGGQLPEYMERSVRENNFVLIVCTQQYKIKSDNRTGGVGYEGDIMTGEVFVQGNDEKFIPLLRKGEWEYSAPSWLQGKYHIDFRGEPYSEDSYKELYDYLFNRREKAPPLGKAKVLAQKSNSLVIRSAKEDKDFALWLSLQLVKCGYPVWCDILDPEPGEYTEAMIEDSIKNKAFKYLFVLSNTSNSDINLLKELRFAYEVMQSRKLVGFIIPIQINVISEENRTILLQGTLPFDFSQSWSTGINDLLSYLEKGNVPKDADFTPSKTNDIWHLQFDAEKGLKNKSEELLSNWFPIRLPEFIFFHELKRSGIGSLALQTENLPFPAIQHNIYLVSFAKADDFAGRLGTNISIKNENGVNLQDFLDGNYNQKLVSQGLSWNFVFELLNKAWDGFFSQTKLQKYILANNRLCYYFPTGFSENGDNKSYFINMEGRRTYRYLAGKHKSNFWHFGIQGRAMLYPTPVYLVKSHVLASSDGRTVWTSKERLHTARRRWFKNWWNVEWRDRLLAAMAYFATSESTFKITLGTDIFMSVAIEPLKFSCPVTYLNSHDESSEPDNEFETLSDENGDEANEDLVEEDDL